MRSRRWADFLLVGGFLGALGLYSAACWANVAGDADNVEAVIRDRKWKRIPPRFESLFDNHLAARDRLVSTYASAKLHYCGTSPTPRVWVGRDGWLFYNHNADERYAASNDPARPVQLEYWAHDLAARRLILEELGCRYLVIVVPNKQTIYPEYLPGFARTSEPDTMDRFLHCQRFDPKLSVLDLREPLRRGKAHDQVFLKTDTHWTTAGAYIAYDATVRALARWFPKLTPVGREHFHPIRMRSGDCDLVCMMGLEGQIIEESDRLHPPIIPQPTGEAVPTEFQTLSQVKTQVFENPGTGLPKAVLFCDSFGEFLTPWLSSHFSRLVSVGTYTYERKLIERERPDVVIQLVVERQFDVRISRKQLALHLLRIP